MRRRLLATIFIAALAISGGVAQADAAGPCAARADLIKVLGEKFHESEAVRGLINPGVILEILVSEKGTWTILATDTHGLSCVITAGEGWDGALMAAALPGA